jgi:hypothetical protein
VRVRERQKELEGNLFEVATASTNQLIPNKLTSDLGIVVVFSGSCAGAEAAADFLRRS